jgi:hypothetical protein
MGFTEVVRIILLGASDVGSATVKVIQSILDGLFAMWLFRAL